MSGDSSFYRESLKPMGKKMGTSTRWTCRRKSERRALIDFSKQMGRPCEAAHENEPRLGIRLNQRPNLCRARSRRWNSTVSNLELAKLGEVPPVRWIREGPLVRRSFR